MKTPSWAWPTAQRLYPLSTSLASRRQASRSTGIHPSCRSQLRWRDCGADGEEGEEREERVSLNGRMDCILEGAMVLVRLPLNGCVVCLYLACRIDGTLAT
jgi:hypothetical protein